MGLKRNPRRAALQRVFLSMHLNLLYIFLQNCGGFQATELKGVDDLESIGLFARFALQIDFYVGRGSLYAVRHSSTRFCYCNCRWFSNCLLSHHR